VSRARLTLVALLVGSTVLFAVGVSAERSESDPHAEPAAAQPKEPGAEPSEAHDGAGEAAEGTGEHTANSGATDSADERVLGVDLESTPLLALAVLAGLGLAALTATRVGRLRGFLRAVAAIALVWALLDVRELVHQLDESHIGIALVAVSVAVLHLAATAISARLARHAETPAP
jgi:hypothetical protein